MAKSAQRIEARRLRRTGESIIVIAKKLGVAKSFVSHWCDDIFLTKQQRKKLLWNSFKGGKKGRLLGAMANKRERINREKNLKNEGLKEIGKLTQRELFLVGAALYWAEGLKKDRRITLVNSDPEMIILFIRWLKECLCVNIEDIYCHVSINQDHQFRINEVQNYWSKITGIPLSGFTKPSYKKVYENFNEHYGTLFLKLRKSTNAN